MPVAELPDGVPTPRTTDGAAALAALTSEPRSALIALDFDGTLAPIVPRPDQVVPHPEVVAALTDLAPYVGQVAIVTGRPALVAVELGRLSGVPRLTVLGHYGLERWHDGELQTPDPHPGVDQVRASLSDLVAQAPEGVALEDKGHSLAVHTRRSADPRATLDALRERVVALAAAAGLEVVAGRYVLEVRPPGTDKGGALRALIEQTRATSVLFAGDDLGDLPAVRAVHELRATGVAGLVVCADSAETPAQLRDQADLVVDGPAGVAALLHALAVALGA